MTDEQYLKIAIFFCNMKYLHGNDFVNSTLRRHSALAKSLIEYEKNRIIELERELNLVDGD